MIDAFISVCSWMADSLILLWNAVLGWGSVGAIVLSVLLFRRLARLVGKVIKK